MSVVRNVTRVTRSPLNPQQWSLDLDCGHEVWVTSRRRPRRLTELCERCEPEPEDKA
jgi:hypothetical protein